MEAINISTQRPGPVPEDIKAKLLAFAKRESPHADDYYTRMSWKGNYVVGTSNDYPLQHGSGQQWTFKPEEIDSL